MPFNIQNRSISPNDPPYIIAELSANHNGSLEQALATIDAAHRSGASAIKLQTYTADTITIDCPTSDFMIRGGLWDGYKLYDLYKRAETPYEWHKTIFEHARKIGISVFSTPFDETAVDLLESLDTPAYKIASFEILDLPLIQYVARKKKPIILSTGMASELEIQDAIDAARDAGCEDLMLLHCISSYPTSINQANLRRIVTLANRFGVQVGLSDHTLGNTAAVAAVAIGACLIEKHFTLDRNQKGPDSEFSMEPEDLRNLCRETKDAWLALGVGDFGRQISEEGSRSFRRSLYFVKDLPAGHKIQPSDIKSIRPGFGLAPKFSQSLIGKALKVAVSRGTATRSDHFHDGLD